VRETVGDCSWSTGSSRTTGPEAAGLLAALGARDA
jgi:hypothetical protein